ncbi:MAG: CDP-diacylglycerol--serine O-phosphatidyltransferase [Xanthomonadales bacterium]|nr:CDP-diacylglycerol--serine O-phosphatidyltransferase [Xanthomonadales bacterium]
MHIARHWLPRRPQAAVPAPAFAMPADAVATLPDPVAFRTTLLELIAAATRRVVIVALYLQDDDAGREIMAALYAVKARRPDLSIALYLDWHRARRGLIGRQRSEGNAAMYRSCRQRHGPGIEVYGVPVQNRELFGVLHVKGFVFDDTVLYSGASLNEVYLACHQAYRLDRYHLLRHAGLADALAGFARQYLRTAGAACRLDLPGAPGARRLARIIHDLRAALDRATYAVPHEAPGPGEVAVTPLLGFGRTHNALDAALLQLLREARHRVILLTPYFNLPRPLRAAVGNLLRRGCRIDIMVGDKTASDFYIPPAEPFKTIGLLPYLYENNLRRFMRGHRRQIASGQLRIHVWRDGGNSYHAKGLFIDDEIAVLTGSNLNPRAWRLDLENALVLRDPHRLLHARHQAEWAALREHATLLGGDDALESPAQYPAAVRKNLRRLKRTRLDRLVNRLL